VPNHQLRSGAINKLVARRQKLVFSALASGLSAPKLWNSMPDDFRTTTCQATSRSVIKTYLYRQAFRLFSDTYLANSRSESVTEKNTLTLQHQN